MMTPEQPKLEVWQRGPIEGVPPLLMPVAHALLQAREDVDRALAGLTIEQIWARPGGAASAGFHVRHLGGSTTDVDGAPRIKSTVIDVGPFEIG